MVKANQNNLLKFRRAPEKLNLNSENDPQQSTDEQSARQSNLSKQKYVTTSTSFAHVIMQIILGICRRITSGIGLRRRLSFYFAIIVFGGILGDFAPILVSALMPVKIQKNNFLNKYFVKIGWFWTLILLFPFISMTSTIITSVKNAINAKESSDDDHLMSLSLKNKSTLKANSLLYVINSNDYKEIIFSLLLTLKNKHLLRLLVNTFIWYTLTSSFEWLDNYTASCSIAGHQTKQACMRAVGKWSGFDISGHTFILIFSNLIILEECTAMIGWESLGSYLDSEQQHYRKLHKINIYEFDLFKKCYISIRILFICLTLLTLIWDFMLLQTALFYHSMVQKLVASMLALFFWSLLYKILYKQFNINHEQIKL